MKHRLSIVLAATAMLAVAAPHASAKPEGTPNGSSAAAKLCAEQKQADKAAFKALWGKHAMRDCIRAGRAEDEVATAEPEEIQNAAQECRAERDLDPAAFAADLRDQRQRSQRVRQVRLDQGPRPTKRSRRDPPRQAGDSPWRRSRPRRWREPPPARRRRPRTSPSTSPTAPTRSRSAPSSSYRVAVSNLGPDAANGVELADDLPNQLDFGSASPSQGSCDRQGKKVSCALGTIPALGSRRR